MLFNEIESFNRHIWCMDFTNIYNTVVNTLYNNTEGFNKIPDEKGDEISRKIKEYTIEIYALRIKINQLYRTIIKYTNKDNSNIDSDLAYRLSKLTI